MILTMMCHIFRDWMDTNLMMDATRLYPYGFDPVQPASLAHTKGLAKPLPRSCAKVKYYCVDFDLSIHSRRSRRHRPGSGTGRWDKDGSETISTVPYDPFKLDVYSLGNLLRCEFHDVRAVLNDSTLLANQASYYRNIQTWSL